MTINLHQAIKLKELGFERPSSWKIEDKYEIIYQIGRDYLRDGYRANSDTRDWGEEYSAYTIGELISFLPDMIAGYKRSIYMYRNQYKVTYDVDIYGDGWELCTVSDKLVLALGDMLIYLIENREKLNLDFNI